MNDYEEIIETYTCANNNEHFLKNHIKMYSPEGYVNFDLERVRTSFDEYNKEQNTSRCCENRCTGKTTLGLGLALHKALFRPNQLCLLFDVNWFMLSNMQHNLKIILEYMYYEKRIIIPKIKTCNKNKIVFENGSEIRFYLPQHATRGFNKVDYVFIDDSREMHISDLYNLRDMLIPIVSKNKHGKILISD